VISADELDAAGDALEAKIRARAPPATSVRGVFPQQQAFIDDESSFQVVFCTRRAAKSYSAGLKAFRKALAVPKCAVLIAGLARLEVKRIWWIPILKDIDERFDCGAVFNETELTTTLPNGSVIYLLGMDANEKEKRKALGQKFPLVIIDEAQDFVTDLNALVYHVLKPAVADYRGTICMLGTPGLIAKGLFYEATRPSGRDASWVMHEWTTFDNTAPAPQPNDKGETCAQRWSAEIEDLKRQKPGIEETPAFRRNYLREWVVDESELVYRYLAGRNDFDELPSYSRGEWHYVNGTDLGYNDPTSWVKVAYHDHDPCLYVLSAKKEAGLDVTAVAVRTKAEIKACESEVEGGFDALVIDGANKQAVEELRKRHEIPWKPADKTGKSDFIEIMNGEFIIGRIRLKKGPACEPLREEYSSLVWNKKKLETTGKREEHEACENHCADGALYAWRFCYQYLSQALPSRPAPGSVQDLQEQEDALELAAEEQFRQQQEETADLIPWAQ
jgi:hypothetical protein